MPGVKKSKTVDKEEEEESNEETTIDEEDGEQASDEPEGAEDGKQDEEEDDNDEDEEEEEEQPELPSGLTGIKKQCVHRLVEHHQQDLFLSNRNLLHELGDAKALIWPP